MLVRGSLGWGSLGQEFPESFPIGPNHPPEEGKAVQERTHDPGRETELHGEPSGGGTPDGGATPKEGAQSPGHTGKHPVRRRTGMLRGGARKVGTQSLNDARVCPVLGPVILTHGPEERETVRQAVAGREAGTMRHDRFLLGVLGVLGIRWARVLVGDGGVSTGWLGLVR